MMGNVQYIAELINKKLLPMKVFCYALNTMLRDYLI